MDNLVSKNISKIKSLTLAIAALVLTSGCCPKDGVDKSVHYNLYNLTLELTASQNQKPVTFLDNESKVTITLNNSTRHDSQYFSQIEGTNRFSFLFDESINDDDISAVEVKLIDYKDQNLNFKTLSKTSFQREPELIAQLKTENFLCAMTNTLSNWILPQANAMSCKTKAGSKRTWRSGYLVPLSVWPEDP